jgi:glycosyltransferase involved in cell wall biosynthesis
MAESPRVTVVMCVYNREAYVGEAICSVLGQTFQDFELIVWDDGSTDGSVARAREAAGGDPRVRLVEAPHEGLSLAANAAAAAARGEDLGWVDSDDRLLPDALAQSVEHLDRRPQVGLVYTQYNVIDAAGRQQGLGSRCRIPYSFDRMLVEFMVFHFRLMRRTVFQKVGGFDPTFQTATDYDLCLRIAEVAPIEQIPKPLYEYRVHPNSISLGRRIEQIEASRRAVEAALERRGLADQVELEVELIPRFKLRRRTRP